MYFLCIYDTVSHFTNKISMPLVTLVNDVQMPKPFRDYVTRQYGDKVVLQLEKAVCDSHQTYCDAMLLLVKMRAHMVAWHGILTEKSHGLAKGADALRRDVLTQACRLMLLPKAISCSVPKVDEGVGVLQNLDDFVAMLDGRLQKVVDEAKERGYLTILQTITEVYQALSDFISKQGFFDVVDPCVDSFIDHYMSTLEFPSQDVGLIRQVVDGVLSVDMWIEMHMLMILHGDHAPLSQDNILACYACYFNMASCCEAFEKTSKMDDIHAYLFSLKTVETAFLKDALAERMANFSSMRFAEHPWLPIRQDAPQRLGAIKDYDADHAPLANTPVSLTGVDFGGSCQFMQWSFKGKIIREDGKILATRIAILLDYSTSMKDLVHKGALKTRWEAVCESVALFLSTQKRLQDAQEGSHPVEIIISRFLIRLLDDATPKTLKDALTYLAHIKDTPPSEKYGINFNSIFQETSAAFGHDYTYVPKYTLLITDGGHEKRSWGDYQQPGDLALTVMRIGTLIEEKAKLVQSLFDVAGMHRVYEYSDDIQVMRNACNAIAEQLRDLKLRTHQMVELKIEGKRYQDAPYGEIYSGKIPLSGVEFTTTLYVSPYCSLRITLVHDGQSYACEEQNMHQKHGHLYGLLQMLVYAAVDRMLVKNACKTQSHKRKIGQEPLLTREVVQSNMTVPCILAPPLSSSSTNISSWQPVSSISCSLAGLVLDGLQLSFLKMVDDTLGQDASPSGGASSSSEALVAPSLPISTLPGENVGALDANALQHASGLSSLMHVNAIGGSLGDQEDKNASAPGRTTDPYDEQLVASSLAEDTAEGYICSASLGLFCNETLEWITDTPSRKRS